MLRPQRTRPLASDSSDAPGFDVWTHCTDWAQRAPLAEIYTVDCWLSAGRSHSIGQTHNFDCCCCTHFELWTRSHCWTTTACSENLSWYNWRLLPLPFDCRAAVAAAAAAAVDTVDADRSLIGAGWALRSFAHRLSEPLRSDCSLGHDGGGGGGGGGAYMACVDALGVVAAAGYACAANELAAFVA
ncbi:hypothetical protein BpHYR1_032834 [Brachionus plicatilis]|uniref:Uncharacterized protein n=1 Tax=Brachionus plicatilis TaxID=10195 RepID=A0A3M7QP47_BRAPC|nr:hypothetical protein BpHYR1_032834 [Brachionus plicatilis]